MTVAEFGRQLGMSPRRLVAIERGEKSVSVDLLLEICHRFRKPLEYFLASTLDVRPYFQLHRGSQLRDEVGGTGETGRAWPCLNACGAFPLATDLPGCRMKPSIMRLDPCHSAGPIRHSGQEFVYVLKGSVRMVTRTEGDEVVTLLSAGDTCFLDASIPHAFEQARVTPYESSPAEVLGVSWRPAWER